MTDTNGDIDIAGAGWTVMAGNSLDRLKELPDNSVDSIVTDPPYGLSNDQDVTPILTAWLTGDDTHLPKGKGFMGKDWDAYVPPPAIWKECLRVLKPGGHLLAFFGSRTQDIGGLSIRLAGFEIRDSIAWVYGSGFPKSHDVSKGIDKKLGAEREVVGRETRPMGYRPQGQMKRTGGDITVPATPEAKQWEGWGTALKPAVEPIVVARKPLEKGKTVAANVLQWGTGAINLDATRVGNAERRKLVQTTKRESNGSYALTGATSSGETTTQGRHPANIILNEETTNLLPESAQPFFYVAKASKADRSEGLEGVDRNIHPTVKPTALMEYLVKMVTPPGGTVLDPFTGSGSTGKAALRLGFGFIGVELTEEYLPIIQARLEHAVGQKEVK